jgi:hypothetical protein
VINSQHEEGECQGRLGSSLSLQPGSETKQQALPERSLGCVH